MQHRSHRLRNAAAEFATNVTASLWTRAVLAHPPGRARFAHYEHLLEEFERSPAGQRLAQWQAQVLPAAE